MVRSAFGDDVDENRHLRAGKWVGGYKHFDRCDVEEHVDFHFLVLRSKY